MSHRAASLAFVVVNAILLMGAGALALGELRNPATCPDLLGIPACYLVFGCATLTMGSRLLRNPVRIVVFLLGAGPAFGLALVASALQLMGGVQCPKGPGGVPLCYLSLALFGTLLALEAARYRGGGTCQAQHGQG